MLQGDILQDPSAGAPATRADIQQLFAAFASTFDDKLSKVKADCTDLQTRAVNSLNDKLKESTNTKWRREGNQRQFQFNQQVPAKYFM